MLKACVAAAGARARRCARLARVGVRRRGRLRQRHGDLALKPLPGYGIRALARLPPVRFRTRLGAKFWEDRLQPQVEP